MTPSTTKCARPTCHRQGSPSHGGYCHEHAYALGITKPKVPAHHAATIIQKHLDNGHTVNQIARTTGVARNSIRDILNGTSTHIRQATLDKLRNTHIETEFVPAWRATRRITSLRAAGHHLRDLVDGMGISHTTINYLIRGKWDTILTETFDRIDAYYQAHEADPVRPATNKVRHKGWPLPLDWDDIDNPDDPAGRVSTNPGITLDTIRRLQAQVEATSQRDTARKLGVSPSTIAVAIRSRPGTAMRPDTLRRLDAA